MTPKAQRHWTISTIVASATIVVSALGLLANGILELDAKSKINSATQVGSMEAINALIRKVNAQGKEIVALRQALGKRVVINRTTIVQAPVTKRRKADPVAEEIPEVQAKSEPGLVPRLFKLLF